MELMGINRFRDPVYTPLYDFDGITKSVTREI